MALSAQLVIMSLSLYVVRLSSLMIVFLFLVSKDLALLCKPSNNLKGEICSRQYRASSLLLLV